MVATSDFSGLTSAACALASAVASAATVSLDRGMDGLRLEKVEADRAGFGALGPHPMPERFLSVLRHQCFELTLSALVLQECLTGDAEKACELGPRVRRAHVYDADRFNSRPRRLRIDQVWNLAELHTAPELLLGRDQ